MNYGDCSDIKCQETLAGENAHHRERWIRSCLASKCARAVTQVSGSTAAFSIDFISFLMKGIER